MNIKQELEETHGLFYVEEKGARLATLNFSRTDKDKIVVTHTEVSEELAGKGVGKQLVAAAVSYARDNKIKLVPLCSFTKAVIKRVKEYQDVL